MQSRDEFEVKGGRIAKVCLAIAGAPYQAPGRMLRAGLSSLSSSTSAFTRALLPATTWNVSRGLGVENVC